MIPPPGRDAVLEELHESHPGITKMKVLARMYVWWPGINADIERSVRLCHACQEVQSSPSLAPLNPWKWPTRPWARLHLDFAGPFQGKTILIIIDAHSKWIEATCTLSTSSSCVIEELRTLFAKFGLPETIVTDNVTGFVSQQFATFLRDNRIRHTTSAPYHPASNGLAERAVQVVKRGLKKVTSGTMNTRLAKVLFNYRITPHSTTGVSPAKLLLHRQPRTRLDLLLLNTPLRVEEKHESQKKSHDLRARERSFQSNDLVYVKNFGTGLRWIPGRVIEVAGPASYVIQLDDGKQRHRHQDHVCIRTAPVDNSEDMSQVMPEDSLQPVGPAVQGSTGTASTPVAPVSETETIDTRNNIELSTPALSSTNDPAHRYPRRLRKPPEHYEPDV